MGLKPRDKELLFSWMKPTARNKKSVRNKIFRKQRQNKYNHLPSALAD
jgi:hypothetical protein